MYCLKCRCSKSPDATSVQLRTTKNNRQMLSAPCPDCKARMNAFVSSSQVGESVIGDALGVRLSLKPTDRQLLAKHKDWLIKTIRIYRSPVLKVFQNIINFFSLGDFQRKVKQYGYDDVFHLSLRFELTDPSGADANVLVTEKNAFPEIYVGKLDDHPSGGSTDVKVEYINVRNPPNIKFGNFWANGKAQFKGDKEFYAYEQKENNCQFFVMNMLKGNNIDTKKAEEFVMQDAYSLLQDYKIMDTIAANVIDFSSWLSRLVDGEGMNSRGVKHKK